MLVEIKIHKENNGDIENDKMNEIICFSHKYGLSVFGLQTTVTPL